MMSMFALCACNASVRSHGPACWLMYADSARSVGSWTGWTCVMRPFEIPTRTCTSPKRLGKSWPVKVPLRAVGDGEGDGLASRDVAEGVGEGLAELVGSCVGVGGKGAGG